jgi:hypothetical protein
MQPQQLKMQAQRNRGSLKVKKLISFSRLNAGEGDPH